MRGGVWTKGGWWKTYRADEDALMNGELIPVRCFLIFCSRNGFGCKHELFKGDIKSKVFRPRPVLREPLLVTWIYTAFYFERVSLPHINPWRNDHHDQQLRRYQWSTTTLLRNISTIHESNGKTSMFLNKKHLKQPANPFQVSFRVHGQVQGENVKIPLISERKIFKID